MTIDALFERAEFEQGFNVEDLRLLHEAINFDGPGARGQSAGVLRGIALVDAELVEVVVVGDVFEAGQLLAGGGERALDGVELGACVGMDAGAGRDNLGSRSMAVADTPATTALESAPPRNRRRFRYFSLDVIADEGISGGLPMSMMRPRVGLTSTIRHERYVASYKVDWSSSWGGSGESLNMRSSRSSARPSGTRARRKTSAPGFRFATPLAIFVSSLRENNDRIFHIGAMYDQLQ